VATEMLGHVATWVSFLKEDASSSFTRTTWF